MSGQSDRSFFCFLYNNSFIPVPNNRMPNSFLKREISICLLRSEKHAALTQPPMIAGKTAPISNFPCRQRKNEAIMAVGIKNKRLIALAALCSSPMTRDSQMINRLPPPTPSPARKPNRQPTISITGKLFSINNAPHPIGSKPQEVCVTTA